MRFTVLIDNNTYIDRYFIGEPAVSYYIEVDGLKILFDLGYSDAFLKNAQKLNINLRDLDYVIFSHGHSDHTWGLDPFIRFISESAAESIPYKKTMLLAHPAAFESKLIDPVGEIGSMISEEKVKRHFSLQYSKEPVYLSENFIYLGEIERLNDFEGKEPIGETFVDGHKTNDFVLDDTALAYKSKNGLVIITGCSHSGICNIVEYAKKITGENRIVDVIGGFHLQNPSEKQLINTVEYFKELKPNRIHACHCTDLNSKIALAQAADLKEVGVGLQLNYD